MKCDRLISLVKNWYLKVQEEAMAPARMVAFMEKHISQCEECLADPDVKQEAQRIREIVLPPSKVPKPKVVRAAKEAIEPDNGVADVKTPEVEAGVGDIGSDGNDGEAADENGSDFDPHLVDDKEI